MPKCALDECTNEATAGWACCSPSHGYQLRNRIDGFQTDCFTANVSNPQVKQYFEQIKTHPETNWWKPMRIDYTVEQAIHYSKFRKD